MAEEQPFDLLAVAQAFVHKGYQASVFAAAEEAVHYLQSQIQGVSVGFGDSATLQKLALYEALSTNNQVIDPQHPKTGQDFFTVAKQCLLTQVFITSVNAASVTGELVNLDGTGNRVAGSLFGHEKVYFVLGRNKLTGSLDQAVWRTRNVAAPQNAKRLGLKTPCAFTGKCSDCNSPDRICNGLMIYLRCMQDIKMEVVLIDQDLGY